MALTLQDTPLIAVAETVIDHTPGPVARWAIEVFEALDKPILLTIVILIMLAFFLTAGRLAEKSWWAPLPVWLGLGGAGLYAVLSREPVEELSVLPIAAGVVTWIVVLSFLTELMHKPDYEGEGEEGAQTRRSVLIRAGGVAVAAIGGVVYGEVVGGARRHAERARRLLNLPISNPGAPRAAVLGVDGIDSWKTSNESFYRIHTAFTPPAIEHKDWSLRIHGMVERELVLTYQDLAERQLTQAWITLNCVSNPVGGDLIGNAWWSGVRIATLLEEAGVDPAATAVLQTSHDGWTCGTPIGPLTDDRNAMIAIGMNGDPLPFDHGFPARMIVPGLYGYVSACKWLVDIEVTTFDEIDAYWIERGWAEEGPVKLMSRIDVPGNGDEVDAGTMRVGGVAWSQTIGISGVQYQLDGGAWTDCELGGTAGPDAAPNDDTWVQWAATLDLDEGDHELLVRAIDKNGLVQTGVEKDVFPDGATGWHSIEFNAS